MWRYSTTAEECVVANESEGFCRGCCTAVGVAVVTGRGGKEGVVSRGIAHRGQMPDGRGGGLDVLGVKGRVPPGHLMGGKVKSSEPEETDGSRANV